MIPRARETSLLGRAATAAMLLGLVAGAAVWSQSGIGFAGLSRAELSIAAVFVAGIVASMAGFAFSAIAGALLAHVYAEPVEMVRVLLVSSITIQAYCCLMIAREVRWRELAPYLLGGLATAPAGVLLLLHAPSRLYGSALGVFLVCYGLYLLRKPVAINSSQSAARNAIVGALGGITGGLAAFPGAFPALWCSARALSKEQQRAICQPYILVMQIATLAVLEHVRPGDTGGLGELWMFVPVSLLAAAIGFAIFSRMSNAQFRTLLLVVLVSSGAVLVMKSW